jgi:hypothetical protein
MGSLDHRPRGLRLHFGYGGDRLDDFVTVGCVTSALRS